MVRLIRLEMVKQITGLSRSSIYADSDFPKPVKLSPGAKVRSVGWVETEIFDWVNARIQDRGAA